jgi:hypothetical protein
MAELLKYLHHRNWQILQIILVRYCQIKTTQHVERKDLLGSRPLGLAEMSSVFYRKVQAMGEGESLWSLIICNHQME